MGFRKETVQVCDFTGKESNDLNEVAGRYWFTYEVEPGSSLLLIIEPDAESGTHISKEVAFKALESVYRQFG